MVSAEIAHTIQHGAIEGKIQTNLVKYYNLDAIISVFYEGIDVLPPADNLI